MVSLRNDSNFGTSHQKDFENPIWKVGALSKVVFVVSPDSSVVLFHSRKGVSTSFLWFCYLYVQLTRAKRCCGIVSLNDSQEKHCCLGLVKLRSCISAKSAGFEDEVITVLCRVKNIKKLLRLI